MTNEQARREDTAAWGGSKATDCPNCGRDKDYVGMCGPCYHGFEATAGGWPVWDQFLERMKRNDG